MLLLEDEQSVLSHPGGFLQIATPHKLEKPLPDSCLLSLTLSQELPLDSLSYEQLCASNIPIANFLPLTSTLLQAHAARQYCLNIASGMGLNQPARLHGIFPGRFFASHEPAHDCAPSILSILRRRYHTNACPYSVAFVSTTSSMFGYFKSMLAVQASVQGWKRFIRQNISY